MTHNADVQKMYAQIAPIIGDYNPDVVVHTLMIVLAICGNQSGMPAEHFKSFVVQQLDALMLIDQKPEGLPS